MRFGNAPTSGNRPLRRDAARAGFTFAEVLAALLFMAIVIPVAIQALTIANRAGVVAERKAVATQLADNLLNELVVTGDWQNTSASGTFPEPWSAYQWRVLKEPWGRYTLPLITVEVSYLVQNREYYVRLSTVAEDS